MPIYFNDSDARTNRDDCLHEVVEARLPTSYEIHTESKNDEPLSTSSPDQGRSSVDTSKHRRKATRRACRFELTKTGFAIIYFLILMPLYGLVYYINHIVCTREHVELEQPIDRINASYIECIAEMENLQEHLHSNENLIRDLNYQVQKLIEQRDIFKKMAYDKT